MKKYILILSLSALATLFACEKTEKIEDFPLYPPKLVLNSYLNPDSTIQMHVSKSLSVLDNAEIKKIDNAVVKLYENDQLIATINGSDSAGFGIYKHDYRPTAGNTYKVEASASKYASISSSTHVPSPVNITNIKMQEVENPNNEWMTLHEFSVSFDDPGEEENYYMLRVLTSGVSYYLNGNNDTVYETYGPHKAYLSSSSNPAVDALSDGDLFFTDQFFNGSNYTIEAETGGVNLWSHKIIVEVRLYTLTKENYLYRKSLGTYRESTGNPFAEPVQVYNNIEGGFGIFAGQNLFKDSIIVDGNDGY